MDFFNTRMGQQFYESHVPQLINELKRIADGLARKNIVQKSETVASYEIAAATRKIQDKGGHIQSVTRIEGIDKYLLIYDMPADKGKGGTT